MPTHKDKPDDFEEIAARRSAELDAAIERARQERQHRYTHTLAEREAERARTSVPPPAAHA